MFSSRCYTHYFHGWKKNSQTGKVSRRCRKCGLIEIKEGETTVRTYY